MPSASRPLRARAATSAARTSATSSMLRTSERRSRAPAEEALSSRAMPSAREAPSTVRARTVEKGRALMKALTGPSLSAAVGGEAVPDEAHGLDGAAAERFVDPLAQVADVDLDDVGVALEGVVPHVLEDLGLGDHLAGPA